MKIWTLNLRGEKRFFRENHPWVFSNELCQSPKGISLGEIIELQNERGEFLALGYGNPHSLISFRILSRQKEKIDAEWMIHKLMMATQYRATLGFNNWSFRLCFSEVDHLPGLIVDYFVLLKPLNKVHYSLSVKNQNLKEDEESQNYRKNSVYDSNYNLMNKSVNEFPDVSKSALLVVQILTAGMENLLFQSHQIFSEFVKRAFENKLLPFSWDDSAFLLRRDSKLRELEGLKSQPVEVAQALEGIDLNDLTLLVTSGSDQKPLAFHVDILEGQKTGFFLDQSQNVSLLLKYVENKIKTTGEKHLKVLDLFSYVGQWGAQLSRLAKIMGIQIEVICVDSSQKALNLAQKNIEREGGVCKILKMDIIQNGGDLSPSFFDVVICDPPALIKTKKDVATGKRGYIKVNSFALRALKPGGLFVSCSCSQHLSESELDEVLTEALQRAKIDLIVLTRGQQSEDHPCSLSFPQGHYLKSRIGVRNFEPGIKMSST